MQGLAVMARAESSARHFIELAEIEAGELRRIVDKAAELKRQRGRHPQPLTGKKLAMIFEKPSTRTRVSFEVAMLELGGHPLYLNGNDMQIGRGESIEDTARVLSRYVDAIMIRANAHETVEGLAAHGSVPVINGLTNRSHPCQILADIMAFEQHRGPIKGKTLAWVGDGNNVANSLISAAPKFGYHFRYACPDSLQPLQAFIDIARKQGGSITRCATPEEAVTGADAVIADTWVSMGDKDIEARMELLTPYQVNGALMAQAKKDALFLHCLPAHRGEEVTAEVIDGPQSVVWDEAENRLHVQKAVLLWCLGEL